MTSNSSAVRTDPLVSTDETAHEHPFPATADELAHELLRAKEDEIQALRDRLHNETVRREHLESVFRDVLSSHSWRLTAPLRHLQRVRRFFSPLCRYSKHSLSVTPVRHLEVTDRGYIVLGPTPEFSLQSSRVHCPRGWLSVQGRVSASSPLHFLLYHSAEKAFSGTRRCWLTFDQEPQLIFVPYDTKHLRLDPFNANGEFSIDEFSVTEVGSIQVLYAKFREIVLPLLRNPHSLEVKLKKAWAVYRKNGLAALRARLLHQGPFRAYGDWVQKYDTISDSDRQKIRARIEALHEKPLISVLLPTYNTPQKYLRLAIESVTRQLYPHWELCIADDASSDPAVAKVIDEYASRDQRIKVFKRETNGHISAASNSALSLAQGEYIALLDHDDELTEDALYQVVHEINLHPDAELIYSDEDKKLADGQRLNPHFKSDWNYDLLLQQNYICHLAVFRAKTLRSVGGFREGFEGAQDWDLMLRVIDAVPRHTIRHIPHILYHWRIIESSTASSTAAKPYVLEAQQRSVAEHLSRRNIGAQVSIRYDISNLSVKFPLSEQPLVSIIIPTKDQVKLLKQVIDGIVHKTCYPNVEVIIIDNGSVEAETKSFLSQIVSDPRISVLRDDSPFNFSRLNNRAAAISHGEMICFLNNDIQVISEEWLSTMVANLLRPELGAVGARLLYPNGTVQHAGIIVGIGGVAGHNHKGRPLHDPGYFNRIILNQNLSAVTAACILIKRSVFQEIGGFDEELSVAFNDVDLCLRIREKGHLITYCADVSLYHHESASRGYETTPEKFARFEQEIEAMARRWGSKLLNDPYYNPNLTILTEDFAAAFPPRIKKPWHDD